MAVSHLASNHPAADALTTHVICAVDGSPQSEEAVRQAAALVAPGRLDLTHEADLLVVGSRGLHGLRALGSVSERVAHRANCSVLVVRPTDASAG